MVQVEATGLMLEFSTNPWRKLVAFLQGDFKRCIVIVGGQSDGFFSLNCHQKLQAQMNEQGWTTVQALFTSWYAGYGAATLENDNEDLDMLIHKLIEKGMEDIVLYGHHTGAQDVLFYMQHGQYSSRVTHVIFQGGLRNADKMKDNQADLEKMYKDTAQQMIDSGCGNQLIPYEMHPIPISAFRFLALGGMQGVEDFFNPAQSEEDMAEWIGHLKVPVLIMFCLEDDYKVKHAVKTETLDKIQVCIEADVTTKWLAGACDEHLNFLKGFEDEVVGQISRFLQDEENKKLEREEEQRREQEAESKRGRSIIHAKSGLRRSASQSSISSIGSNR